VQASLLVKNSLLSDHYGYNTGMGVAKILIKQEHT